MSFTNQALGALGTATGALAAGEHIKQQKQANDIADKNAAINAAEHIEDTVKEYGEADMEAGLKGQEIANAQADLKKERADAKLERKINHGEELTPDERLKLFVGYDGYQGAGMRVLQKNVELEKLQKAQQSYQMKADAKRLQAEIYRDQINKVGKKGESLGTIKFSWDMETK